MADFDMWFRVGLGLANFALALYVFSTGRSRVKEEQLKGVELRVTTLERTQATFDERIKLIPSNETILRTLGSLDSLHVEIRALKDSIGAQSRAVERINDYLLGGAKK